MEKFLDAIAPASRSGFWIKSLLLVSTYTAFDLAVRTLPMVNFEPATVQSHIVTFLIGAPFALFVMWIMSRQRSLKEQLKTLSHTDSLTGLSNRACFLKRATELIESGNPAVVLMIDLDHFKKINDTYGHYFGDLTLRRIAQHLRAATRETDIVGRLGGEEFAVFMPDTSPREARQIAERICTVVSLTTMNLDGSDNCTVDVTMSVGGAATLPDTSLVRMLSMADEAMYLAKNAGRAAVVFHELSETEPTPSAA